MISPALHLIYEFIQFHTLPQNLLVYGPYFSSFGQFLSSFGRFCTEWTLRRIPFYVFLHFFNLKVPCITRFQVPMGSTPAGPFKCTRTHDAVDPLTRLRQRAIQHDLGPYFWSTFVDFRPLFGQKPSKYLTAIPPTFYSYTCQTPPTTSTHSHLGTRRVADLTNLAHHLIRLLTSPTPTSRQPPWCRRQQIEKSGK